MADLDRQRQRYSQVVPASEADQGQHKTQNKQEVPVAHCNLIDFLQSSFGRLEVSNGNKIHGFPVLHCNLIVLLCGSSRRRGQKGRKAEERNIIWAHRYCLTTGGTFRWHELRKLTRASTGRQNEHGRNEWFHLWLKDVLIQGLAVMPFVYQLNSERLWRVDMGTKIQESSAFCRVRGNRDYSPARDDREGAVRVSMSVAHGN
ncbi:hypothetical protein PM082_021388 [Marasmius tenuissimus]|nr:hypothetical protein PM082_021388 [Marasmius tenuissimus]